MASIYRKAMGTMFGNQVLALFDWENLLLNVPFIPPDKPNFIVDWFDGLIHKRIPREIGEIVRVEAFVREDVIFLYGEQLNELRVHIEACPLVWTKDRKGRVNTTDQKLIEEGMELIDLLPKLTHLCIGSGDRDFTSLVRFAKRKGLKFILVAGSKRSRSPRMEKLADLKYFIGE